MTSRRKLLFCIKARSQKRVLVCETMELHRGKTDMYPSSNTNELKPTIIIPS